MTAGGTAAYATAEHLPPVVTRAVELARSRGFEHSSLPDHGRLLRVLARGVPPGGTIGETGTGAGVGLAWIVSTAEPSVRIVSVERDADLATAAAGVFAAHPNVTVLAGDWTAIVDHAPFDLLVLDGGGQGKDDEPAVNPRRVLKPGGTLVIDDFTPSAEWPPTFEGAVDEARLYWLEHPDLLATEIRTTPGTRCIVAMRKPGS